MAREVLTSRKGQTPPAAITVRGSRWVARPRLPGGYRPSVDLGPSSWTEAKAREAYAAACERGLVAVLLEKRKATPPPAEEARTVRYVATLWTSGKMLETHGRVNGLRKKTSAKTDVGRFKAHVFDHIGDHDVASVTSEDVTALLAKMPATSSSGSRRHVLALLSMFFRLCEYPMRLRPEGSNPIKKWMIPAKDKPKLMSYLYPTEFVALASCAAVPLTRRVYYALATYTGLRKGSLLAIQWRDVDFVNEIIVALKTKNGRPLHFRLQPSLCELLRRFRQHVGGKPDDLMLATLELTADMEAAIMRIDLQRAGVTRDVLFRDDPAIQKIRFHDLRATFTTWAKRDNRTDAWIQERTGHQSKEMLDHYTRAAHGLADIEQEPFPDLLPLFAGMDAAMDAEQSSDANPGCRTGNAPVEDGVTFHRGHLLPHDTVSTRGFEPLPSCF